MKIKSFVFNPFYENTYVIWDDSKTGIIIDPGCYEKYEQEELLDFIHQENITIQAIVNTHCHIDHVLGNYAIKTALGCPLWLPEAELNTFKAVAVYAPNYGMPGYTEATPDKLLQDEDLISAGEISLRSIACPGHSPGHLVFYDEASKTLIGGDVLFRQSIGRTDLPGGNHQQLITNIKQRIYTLPDDTTVYPGHGPSTTIGFEKSHNPYVKG